MAASDKHYSERVVWLPELARDEDVLDGYTFSGCQLNGPAVLVFIENVTFSNNKLQGDLDALFWEIPPSRQTIIGAIGLRNCTIDNCTLTRLGIGGPVDLRAQFQ